MTSFKSNVDAVVSALFAIKGWDRPPSFRIARRLGEKKYDIFVKGCDGAEQSLAAAAQGTALSAHPFLSDLTSTVTDHVVGRVLADTWRPVSARGVIGSSWDIADPRSWERATNTAPFVWPTLLQSGSGAYLWCRQLRDVLLAPFDKKAAKEFSKITLGAFRTRPDWEKSARVSLLTLPSDPAWIPALIKSGCSLCPGFLPSGCPLATHAVLSDNPALLSAMIATVPLGVWRQSADHIPAAQHAASHPRETPVWLLACALSSPLAVRALFEADPSLLGFQSIDGKSGLHFAAAAGNSDVVDALVGFGADLSLEDASGAIPAECVPVGHDDLFNKMESLRASPVPCQPHAL